MRRFRQTTSDEYRRVAILQHSWMQRGQLFVYSLEARDTPDDINDIVNAIKEWAQGRAVEIHCTWGNIWIAIDDLKSSIEFKLIFC